MRSGYPGRELELFRHAVNWKAYYASHLRNVIRGETLEVGAGIGGSCRFLCDGTQRSWTCLEPDGNLLRLLRSSLAADPLPVPFRILHGTVADLSAAERFDTVLYIDVLEHIEDDSAELERSARHLLPGGRIVVLAPAHDWLFSPFDRAIGHYRRYSRSRLTQITPDGLVLQTAYYLDSAGILASPLSRLVWRGALPTLRQVQFWDSMLVRVSRALDPLTLRRLGKSIVAVWIKASAVPE